MSTPNTPQTSTAGSAEADIALLEEAHAGLANAIRALAMDAVEAAKSGHPGMPMGLADVATVLFTRFVRFDPADTTWPDRDRVVLSAGHGSMLLYSVLHLLGVPEITRDQIRNFRQLGSLTAGHPEWDVTPGVETTTGPLGQGLGNAVGMAMAERMLANEFGSDLVDHFTYVLASDGDLMEGISHESISLAGHLKLSKLIVLFDDNGISIDGPLSLAESGDQVARFEAAGWEAMRVDGHDPEAVAAAIEAAQGSDRPTLIACKTTIGYGAPTKAGKASSHGAALGEEEVAGARKALDWPHAPFEVPDEIVSIWRAAGARGGEAKAAWAQRRDAHASRAAFDARMAGTLPADVDTAFRTLIDGLIAEPSKEASRKSSGRVLKALAPVLPALVGGSADLSGSNSTQAPGLDPLTAEDFSGRYIHFGVREHAMAAAMNGMALHGGFVPYGGTFLVFTDYCRPSIRLAALMGLKVVFVMTHDSIGVGEDGPTHQPVEHLAALRAIPGLAVMRPADAVETAECWQAALSTQGPTVLALSRQDLPQLRLDPPADNLSARGGYELRPLSEPASRKAERPVTLIATGSEVQVAVETRERLAKAGIAAKVVSVPSMDRLEALPAAEREALLGGPKALRVVIEAAVRFGWDRYLGTDGLFIGMDGFGASAPAGQLYQHFGITGETAAQRIEAALGLGGTTSAPKAGA